MNPLRQRHLLVWPEAGVDMAFRLIPPGSFRMGSRGYDSNEEPIHRVTIAEPFWLAETPVTQAQFALWTRVAKVEHTKDFAGRPDHPSESLDWRQAVAFCAWLGKVKAGELPAGFPLACLPTEAEWEYACRAGMETEYYTGDGEMALAQAGWFGDFSGSGSTHPVRLKAANAFGLYDLHGNVWEWCHDAWDERAHRIGVDGAPDPGARQRAVDWQAGLDHMTRSSQTRVLRGGSWYFTAGYCRSACRVGYGPDARDWSFGFRVCLVRGPSCPEKTEPSGSTEAEPARRRRPRDEAGVGEARPAANGKPTAGNEPGDRRA